MMMIMVNDRWNTTTTTTSFGWLFGFYGISTIVGYLMPNQFLWK